MGIVSELSGAVGVSDSLTGGASSAAANLLTLRRLCPATDGVVCSFMVLNTTPIANGQPYRSIVLPRQSQRKFMFAPI
jgi:hypothetical protein